MYTCTVISISACMHTEQLSLNYIRCSVAGSAFNLKYLMTLKLCLIQYTGTGTFIGTSIQQNNTRLTINTKDTIKINMVN